MLKNIILLFILLSSFIYADQNIEIVGGGYSLPKLAIINFTNDKLNNSSIANIISNDLNITGEFKANSYDDNYLIKLLANNSKIPGDFIVSGSITGDVVNFKLQSNNESKSVVISGTVNNYNEKNIRLVAHTIANQIYKQITNTEGVFTSKIAFSVYDKIDEKYKIIIADYDGYNQKIIYKSKNILASISLQKNGSQIAYVEIANRKPQVFVQNLYANKVNGNMRYAVASFPGSNSSPVFMPDGNQLLATLTTDDGSNIFLIDNNVYSADSYRKSIVNWGDISTEADIGMNESIIFTSNHDSGAQLFMTNLKNLKSPPVRLTLGLGNYNVTPRLSHDLQAMVFIHRIDGDLKVYYMDFNSKSSYPITKTNHDLAPSFSANDKLIAYTSDNFVYIVNKNGTISTKLKNIDFSKIIDVKWANF
jgi:TolB protein